MYTDDYNGTLSSCSSSHPWFAKMGKDCQCIRLAKAMTGLKEALAWRQ